MLLTTQVHHAGLLRVVVLTLRPILAGEQLLADYGPSYWRNPRRKRARVAL